MDHLRLGIFVAFLIATGCAVPKSRIHTYRLVADGSNSVLVPPGVASQDVAQRTFTADVPVGTGRCVSTAPITIENRRKRARVTVRREMLLPQPAGWLNEWTADLESQGCIAPGAGPRLAEQIAGALPLEASQAFHLLYSNQLDITPNMTIQVVSPIFRDGVAISNTTTLEPVDEQANGNNLTLAIRSSANLAGYETASYTVRRKPGGMGLSVVPLYADRHLGAEVERRPQPAIHYFRFPAEAAFYRVFYEAQQTEYTAIIIAARTRAELERRARLLGTGAASCDKLNNELCVAVPKQVAINGLVSVTVNGSETWVAWGTSIGGVIRASGERQANILLPRLMVHKPFNGKPAAVEFERNNPAILNLVVTGGEAVAWK